MAKLIIPMPRNCLRCDVLKEWYGTERDTTFVRCHAGKCEMSGRPGNYVQSDTRPNYCPVIEEESEDKRPFVFAPR